MEKQGYEETTHPNPSASEEIESSEEEVNEDWSANNRGSQKFSIRPIGNMKNQ